MYALIYLHIKLYMNVSIIKKAFIIVLSLKGYNGRQFRRYQIYELFLIIT